MDDSDYFFADELRLNDPPSLPAPTTFCKDIDENDEERCELYQLTDGKRRLCEIGMKKPLGKIDPTLDMEFEMLSARCHCQQQSFARLRQRIESGNSTPAQ